LKPEQDTKKDAMIFAKAVRIKMKTYKAELFRKEMRGEPLNPIQRQHLLKFMPKNLISKKKKKAINEVPFESDRSDDVLSLE